MTETRTGMTGRELEELRGTKMTAPEFLKARKLVFPSLVAAGVGEASVTAEELEAMVSENGLSEENLTFADWSKAHVQLLTGYDYNRE